MDCAFSSDVGEGGERIDVHYAPDGVGGVADHVIAQRSADSGMCAVAALAALVKLANVACENQERTTYQDILRLPYLFFVIS